MAERFDLEQISVGDVFRWTIQHRTKLDDLDAVTLLGPHLLPAGRGWVCEVCGGRLVARADETPEAVQGRLPDHHEKTWPVMELFRVKEVVVAVDPTGPVAQVQATNL